METTEASNPPSQADEVNAAMNQGRMKKKWEILPAANTLTFWDTDVQTPGHSPKKLFLGGNRYPQFEVQVWSSLKLHPNKASEIRITKHTLKPDGEVEVKTIRATHYGDIQLMYPFQVLLQKGTDHSRPSSIP